MKVDNEILPSKIARAIERYVSKPNPISILMANTNKGPDSFVYKISIQSGKKKQEMEFAEFTAKKDLKIALNYVLKYLHEFMDSILDRGRYLLLLVYSK